jgi:hypothetical protein
VEAAERFADGRCGPGEFPPPVGGPCLSAEPWTPWAAADLAQEVRYGEAEWAPDGASGFARRAAQAMDNEKAAQAALLRDLFGNPFRLAVVDPAWLIWNGRAIPRLAQAAYDERHLPWGGLDNARLGVLADALEDAGCADPALLGHLRSGGEHVRGCFAVDALLGKE